jgi:hypothetical protein
MRDNFPTIPHIAEGGGSGTSYPAVGNTCWYIIWGRGLVLCFKFLNVFSLDTGTVPRKVLRQVNEDIQFIHPSINYNTEKLEPGLIIQIYNPST